MISVGIVVPTLGTRTEWLDGALATIVGQTGADVRVIVVTPNFAQVNAIAQRHGVEVLHSTTPGLSAAVNEGWGELSDCEFLTWLGDDDLLAPGGVAASLDYLYKHPKAVATYGNVRYMDASGRTIFVTRPRQLAAAYLTWGKDLVPQPGSLVRRSALGETGALDTSLRYAMDLDLFLKLKVVGKVAYLDREVAAFRLHAGSITGSNNSSHEASEVRARYLGRRQGTFSNRSQPLFRMLDRVLYRALRSARERGVDALALYTGQQS